MVTAAAAAQGSVWTRRHLRTADGIIIIIIRAAVHLLSGIPPDSVVELSRSSRRPFPVE